MPTPVLAPSLAPWRFLQARLKSLLPLAFLAACAAPPPPTTPTTHAEPMPLPVAIAPPDSPPAGPRCPPSKGPGVVFGVLAPRPFPRGLGNSPTLLQGRRAAVRTPLPQHVPFTFREVPSAQAPSASAGLGADDWQELAHWMLRAVLAAQRPVLAEYMGTPQMNRQEAGPVAYLPLIPPKSGLRKATTRVALIKTLGPAVRAIAASSWFAGLYARNRALEIGPTDALAPPEHSASRVRTTSLTNQCAYLGSLQTALTMPDLTAAERTALEKGIAVTEAQIDRWRGDATVAEEWAASEHAGDVAKAVEQRRKAQERAAKLALVYPESPQAALLVRLDALVAATADVDFGAKTVQKGRHKVFVDPALEQKPDEWKLAYRLGKPTIEALRAFAAEWRKDLVAAAGTPMVKPLDQLIRMIDHVVNLIWYQVDDMAGDQSFSSWQPLVQPSPLTALPSSHCSGPFFPPSPQ